MAQASAFVCLQQEFLSPKTHGGFRSNYSTHPIANCSPCLRETCERVQTDNSATPSQPQSASKTDQNLISFIQLQ